MLLGFFGLIVHCSSFNDHQDPCLAGCRNCCYGWGILDCLPASLEACFALVLVFIVVFAILGIAYGFLAATMAVQRIWQRHYHILTKRELTKARNLVLVLSVLIVTQQISDLLNLVFLICRNTWWKTFTATTRLRSLIRSTRSG